MCVHHRGRRILEYAQMRSAIRPYSTNEQAGRSNWWNSQHATSHALRFCPAHSHLQPSHCNGPPNRAAKNVKISTSVSYGMLAQIMRQSSNVQIHCSNRTFTKRGFTQVLIILHISSDWELQSNKGKICFWVPRHIQNRTIQTFVTQLWAMSTPFEFWLALALLDFVSSNRRKWSAEVFRKSPCCSTFEALRKIYIKIIHPKSEKVCRVCSPVQNILRKKCVNLDNKILRQKCVNHEMKLRFTRKWVY